MPHLVTRSQLHCLFVERRPRAIRTRLCRRRTAVPSTARSRADRRARNRRPRTAVRCGRRGRTRGCPMCACGMGGMRRVGGGGWWGSRVGRPVRRRWGGWHQRWPHEPSSASPSKTYSSTSSQLRKARLQSTPIGIHEQITRRGRKADSAPDTWNRRGHVEQEDGATWAGDGAVPAAEYRCTCGIRPRGGDHDHESCEHAVPNEGWLRGYECCPPCTRDRDLADALFRRGGG